MKRVFFVTLIVCMAIVGCVSAAAPAGNQTPAITATTAPQLIGGDMGTYLVKANVDGANVTFDSDFKGVTNNSQLAVPVYTTGTPYRVITVEKAGYALYSANITSVPGKNETVEIDVTLAPLAAANTTAGQANVTAPAPAGTQANVTAEMTTAAQTSPEPTKSGSLPFAAFAAFGVIGILSIRSRR